MQNSHIVLIRHAQSEFNAKGSLQPDCPLSNNGHLQASQLHGEFDLVICSSLMRAKQTLFSSRIKYTDLLISHLCREILDGNPVNHFFDEKVSREDDEIITKRIHDFKDLVKTLNKKYPRIAVISHFCFLTRLTGKKSFDNAERHVYTLE